jgi:acetyl-CoA carboxylase biotin carboxylase subunit
VREDSGVYQGWTVPLDYDPMLSKLIVHAADRPAAIARMRRALDEYFIGGIKTNLPLFRRILEHPDFVAGNIDTGFLDRLLATKTSPPSGINGLAEIAAVSAALFAATGLQKNGQNGQNGGLKNGSSEKRTDASGWKRAARSEGVRSE